MEYFSWNLNCNLARKIYFPVEFLRNFKQVLLKVEILSLKYGKLRIFSSDSGIFFKGMRK